MTTSGAPAPLPVAPVPARIDPRRLLRMWHPGRASWFSGPAGGMLATGVAHEVPDADPDAVARRLHSVADEGSAPPLVIGALPYDPAGPAHLVVPESVERSAPLGAVLTTETPTDPLSGALRPGPGSSGYEAMVGGALARMAAGELEKVVLARTLDVVADTAVDAAPMLRELARRDPRRYVFAIDLPRVGPGPRTLLGASPELLVARRGDEVTANPLAGTIACSPDPVEDRARGEALLASAKDRHEHALVIDEVAAGLSGLVTDLEVPKGPSLVRTATLWHLSTVLRGQVADPSIGALHVARALHPTPAVCGVPRDRALAAIDELEPFDRGFYTGMVGWTDVLGDGEWTIALRCGEVADDSVRLYAGAGIVPASQPSEELAETGVKLRTLLATLGLHEA